MGGLFFTGRNDPTNTTTKHADQIFNIAIPTTAVKLQMYYVLTNWTRKLKITTFPDSIMTLIVDKFTFQKYYTTKHVITLNRQKKNIPLIVPKPFDSTYIGYGDKYYRYVFKILVIGNSGVGKTCLCYRYCDFTFGKQYKSNLGADFRIRSVEIDNKQCTLQIWDTAGQERWDGLTRSYYRGATGVLLVYDVSNTDSFKNIRHWNNQIEIHKTRYVHKVLVGNKTDLLGTREVVHVEEAKQLCEDLNIAIFIGTSAKTGEKVEDAFYQLTRQIYEFQQEFEEKQLWQPFRDFKS